MAEPFRQLLDATLEHLQQLKEEGVRYVTVSSERLRALASPISPPAQQSTVATRAESPPSPLASPPEKGEIIGTPQSIGASQGFGTAQTAVPLTKEAKAQAMAERRER